MKHGKHMMMVVVEGVEWPSRVAEFSRFFFAELRSMPAGQCVFNLLLLELSRCDVEKKIEAR
jgi:hypothetical protein